MDEVIGKLFAARPPLALSVKVFWALLRRHHGTITLDEAAGLLRSQNVVAAAVYALLLKAMNLGEKRAETGTKSAAWSVRDFLVEWVALGGSPEQFWRQTPKSYVAVMEGMARAVKRETDIAIATAWHTAIFALSGYAGKLKGKKLSDFLSDGRPSEPSTKHAEAIAFFHSLKARGVPVDITRH